MSDDFEIGEVADLEMGNDSRTVMVGEILPDGMYGVWVRTTGQKMYVRKHELHKLYLVDIELRDTRWKEYRRYPQQ